MSLARHTLIATVVLFPLLGCNKLLGGRGDAGDVDGGATVATTAPVAADAAVAREDAAVPVETPAEQTFTPPGACIAPLADAQARAGGGRPTEQALDLDGDGKPDKAIRIGIGGDDRASPTFLYVMRGTCGVFVGDVPSTSLKLSGNRSKGLKSIEAIAVDTSCTDPCGCKDRATAFFFNGKAYQSSGKPRDVARKCDGAAKKFALPKCTGDQGLFAEADDTQPFCSRSCSSDADCKPAKCDLNGFVVDDKTGNVFTGSGRSSSVCGKGAPATAPAATATATAAATALSVPPGSPAIIQNPKLLDCPTGYTKLIGNKTCNKNCRTEKCPSGSTCTPPMSVCM